MDASEIMASPQDAASSGLASTGLSNSGGATNGMSGIGSNGANNKSGGKESNVNWLADYVRGADFEVYYVSLSPKYKSAMGHLWPLMVEGIYLEFGAMLVGVCCRVCWRVCVRG